MKISKKRIVFTFGLIITLSLVVRLIVMCVSYQKTIKNLYSQSTKYKSEIYDLKQEIKDYQDTYKYAFSFASIAIKPVLANKNIKKGDFSIAEIGIGAADMVYKGRRGLIPYILYAMDVDTITESGGPYDTVLIKNASGGVIKVKPDKPGKHNVKGVVVMPKPWKTNAYSRYYFEYNFNVLP